MGQPILIRRRIRLLYIAKMPDLKLITGSPPPENPANATKDTPKVFTYLDETMRSVNAGTYATLEISPWMIYGEQENKIYPADEVAKAAQPTLAGLNYKIIIPVQLSPLNGLRVPEIYYLALEYFSKRSNVAHDYCHRTPKGFQSLFHGTPEQIKLAVGSMDRAFDELMKVCVEDQSQYSRRTLTKEYMDTVILPDFIGMAIILKRYTIGDPLLHYNEMAAMGDYLPLVKYMMAHNYQRQAIFNAMYSLVSDRLQPPHGQVYFRDAFAELIESDAGIMLGAIERFFRVLLSRRAIVSFAQNASKRRKSEPSNNAKKWRDGTKSSQMEELS